MPLSACPPGETVDADHTRLALGRTWQGLTGDDSHRASQAPAVPTVPHNQRATADMPSTASRTLVGVSSSPSSGLALVPRAWRVQLVRSRMEVGHWRLLPEPMPAHRVEV